MMRGRKKEIKWSGTFGFKLWQRVLIFAILSLKTNDKNQKKKQILQVIFVHIMTFFQSKLMCHTFNEQNNCSTRK